MQQPIYLNILEKIQKETIYIVSHNGTCFDFLILKKLFKEYGKNKRITRGNSLDNNFINRLKFIDTLLLSRMSIKGETYSQPSLCKRYGIINSMEHRALGDIYALEELYDKLTLNLSYNTGNKTNIYKNNRYEVYKQINII